MPKTCKIVRENVIKKGLKPEKRRALREIISNPNSSVEEVSAAVDKLDGLPVNESPCRHVRRCSQCGRQRGVYRRFNLCRMCMRKFLTMRFLPGLVKSSW